MPKLIPHDEKFWLEASEYHTNSELGRLESFLASVQAQPLFKLMAGGLNPAESATIQIRLAAPTHGIRPDAVFMCVEVQPTNATLRFWIQYYIHERLDRELEQRLRSILNSGTRKWHNFNTKRLDTQIELAQKALDEVAAFIPDNVVVQ